jgi:catechol 2,3-dioxygenase-like lactoylglutathione lyase family enzyme
MIGYITIGAVDIEQAKTFYDSILGIIGWKQFADYGDPIGDAQNETGDGQTIWICQPFDGGTALAGNGIMIGFDAETKQQLHAFHDAAIKAGGRDEGAPGPRPAYGPNWYAAYLRDPTGNKLAIVCRKPG